jgi:hypothetical protein
MTNYKEIYFKCDICNNIYLKKDNSIIKDDNIKKLLKNSYFLDRKICNDCYNYIKWENGKY